MYKGKSLVIASMHKKEKVLAPLLLQKLGVSCVIPPDFNSDTFGTFSGEIHRSKDPLDTARDKCTLAMQITNCDLAVSSEGSFGPHPFIPFVNCDHELLLFVDRKNKIEISWNEISLKTNFNGAYVKSIKELKSFAKAVKFPSHGLIIRKSPDSKEPIHKGIHDQKELVDLFEFYHRSFESVYVETDMRAMHNPSRMKVIKQAGLKLIRKIKSKCPSCRHPGFSVIKNLAGLPCEQCHMPTKSTLKRVSACLKCKFEKEQMYPNKKLTEDPMYCEFCNP